MTRRRVGARQRGAAAITAALAMLVLGGFAALVVNVGHFMMVRNQLQNACDSGALAGARELDGSPEGVARAAERAARFGSLFHTDRDVPVRVDPADVVLGRWDWSQPKAYAFTPESVTAPGAALRINAVRVQAGREAARGNPLDVFLPAFSGDRTSASVTAEAVAVGGGPAEECSVPFAFADCLVIQDNRLQCEQTLVLRNDGADNMGFSNLADGVASVNTAGIIGALDGDCVHVGMPSSIGVSNGNNLNKNVVEAVQRLLARRGPTMTVPIVSPRDGCPAKFNGVLPVAGFATVTVLDVQGPPSPYIRIRIDCDATAGEERAGGGWFGTRDPRPGLVR